MLFKKKKRVNFIENINEKVGLINSPMPPPVVENNKQVNEDSRCDERTNSYFENGFKQMYGYKAINSDQIREEYYRSQLPSANLSQSLASLNDKSKICSNCSNKNKTSYLTRRFWRNAFKAVPDNSGYK